MAVTLALAGNPNCGKTTLFNQLTGSAQHVGNWPGVTVDVKTGRLLGCWKADASAVDLPGVYSLSPFSAEEGVARDFIRDQSPDVIVNIADATALERSLHLTLQLLALSRPMVLALNMTDELHAQGGSIDIPRLEALLGVPVVSICAKDGSGVDSLIRRAMQAARSPAPAPVSHSAADIARLCVTSAPDDSLTRRIDAVLLHPALSLPLLALIIFSMLFIAFGPVGAALSDLFAAGCDQAVSLLSKSLIHTGEPLRGLIIDGALGGAVSVLGFLPMILLLFCMLSLLEDSGVMARMAFTLDRPLRQMGLDGRCFLPLMLGFGCTVPAVMCARGMSGPRERRLTILLSPFMSCSARAPIYALFAHVFFRDHVLAVMCAAYGLGIAAAFASGWLMRRLQADRSPSLFFLELPRYRMPTLRSTLLLMEEKARDFIRRAFGVICLSSMAVWFLRAFTPALTPAPALESSLLGAVALRIAPLFRPAGFGSAQAAAAILSGLIAKENVISTLHVLTQGRLTGLFPTPLHAAAFLVFIILYSPCAAAFAAMRRELGTWRAIGYALFPTILAWCTAVCVFQLGCLFGL